MGFSKKWKALLKPNQSSSQPSSQSPSQSSSQAPNQSPDQFTALLLDHPRYYLVDEGVHDDNEPIYPNNFPWAKFVANWSRFNPNTKNPRLEKSYSKGHHGSKSGKTKGDFLSFHFGFCLEHCVDQDGTEYRCMNQFLIDSTQCKDHPKAQYKDGPNKIWKEMKDGRVGYWGMINKPRAGPATAPPTAKFDDDLDWIVISTIVDECVAAGQDRGTAWAQVVAEKKAERNIAKKIEKDEIREETRKTQQAAAFGKSRQTGNARNPKTHKSSHLAARDSKTDGNIPPPSRRRKQEAEGKGRGQLLLASVDENTAPN